MYYLNYDSLTGEILGAPYHSEIHGKKVPIYNSESIKNEKGDVIHEIGTLQVGTKLDLSAIPLPMVEITELEHDDFMQHQGSRKIDISTKKLIEYIPPSPSIADVGKQKLKALDAEYQPQFLELARAWAGASMDGKTELANSITADSLALKQEYEQKRGVING